MYNNFILTNMHCYLWYTEAWSGQLCGIVFNNSANNSTLNKYILLVVVAVVVVVSETRHGDSIDRV